MARFLLSAFADEAAPSLEGQIEALRKNGIYYIEPRNINGRGILEHSEAELYEIKKTLDKAGIKVNSLGSPIGKYSIEEPFEPHFELFLKALRAALILEAPSMRIFSFYIPKGRLFEYKNEVIKRLKAMAAAADECGVRLSHENESLIYGEMPSEVASLLDAVPSLYSVFDPANYRMNGADALLGLEASLKRFGYMHVKDAIYETKTIVPAGEGEGRIAEAINIIDEKFENTVFLTLEPHLHIFDAYKSIDTHELKGKYSFKTSTEAFDFAAKALKNLLTKNGYREDGNKEWTR